MNAEIISVGTEILMGEILNTNAKYISEQLVNVGINVYYQTSVGDNEVRLKDIFQNSMNRSDIIILTGGLGPTQDDITREVIASLLNRKLILNEDILYNIKNYFDSKNVIMTDNNIKQALIPENAEILKNIVGTAVGILIEENNKIIILLPGPPNEMELMFKEEVIPYLKQKSQFIIYSKIIKMCGIGESEVEDGLMDLIDKQSHVTIATYAKESLVDIRIAIKSNDEREALGFLEDTKNLIYERYRNYIYAEDDQNIIKATLDNIVKNNMTISILETFTNGMFSYEILKNLVDKTILKETFIVYNETRIKSLYIDYNITKNENFVNKQVALELATNIAINNNSNIGISLIGTKTIKESINLIYIGIYINGNVTVEEIILKGKKDKIGIQCINKLMYSLFLKLK